MRGIGRKTSRLFKAALESRECGVQHADQATDLVRRTFRWNAFVESFGSGPFICPPNFFNWCERNRPEPPTTASDQQQNDWYHNHDAPSDFPTELLDVLQISADVQGQFLITKYSDPNGSSTDLAGVKRFDLIFQDRFA